MPLYTISANYDGGTYLLQLRAENSNQAAIHWAEQVQVKEIPNLGPKSKNNLIEDLKQQQRNRCSPVPINGLVNVWCSCSMIRGKLVIINIFQTDES